MFKWQEHVLKEWKTADVDVALPAEASEEASDGNPHVVHRQEGEEEQSVELQSQKQEASDEWESDHGFDREGARCQLCGSIIPTFAVEAHQRFVSPL